MRKVLFLFMVLLNMGWNIFAQSSSGNVNKTESPSPLKPTIGIVIYSNDAETVWNAFRIANFSESKGDTVTIFLLGKGVEALTIENEDFDIKQKMDDFMAKGGVILACGTCLSNRHSEENENIIVSTLSDLYSIIKSSKILLTF